MTTRDVELHGDVDVVNREIDRVVARLGAIDDEQHQLQQMLTYLQGRCDELEQQWSELITTRDELEHRAWELTVEQRTAVDASPPLIDPAPEAWDLPDLSAPLPLRVFGDGTAPVRVGPEGTVPIPLGVVVGSRSH